MSTTEPNSGREVAKATGIVSIATLLSRVLGMIRDMLVASYFGAGLSSDAFFAAFKVPNLLRRLVAEGSLAGAFVPIFTEELSHSEGRAKRAITAVTGFALLLTSALSVIGVIFAEPITLALAPGFGIGTEKTALSVSLLRIMFPYTLLVSILALTSGILNCLGKFALPALWPVFLNAGIIFCILVVAPFVNEPVYVLAWSVIFGGVISLLPQLLLLKRLGYPLAVRSPFGNPVVRNLIRLMLPSLLSGSLYQLMVFINTLLASLLIEGSVTWLYYADRLFQFPLGVFTVAIGTAILPSLSRLSAANNDSAIAKQLTQALAWMTVITVPATVGLIAIATPIVSLVYERGAFGPQDTYQTTRSLIGFSVGLWSVSCQSILVRAFLAKKQTTIPSLITCGSMIFNVSCAFALMGPAVGSVDTAIASGCVAISAALSVVNLGHAGLALAGSLGSFGALLALALFLPRIGINLQWGELLKCLRLTLLASAPMGGGLLLLMAFSPSNWITVGLGIPAGVATFFLMARLLKLHEANEAWAFIRARLSARAHRS